MFSEGNKTAPCLQIEIMMAVTPTTKLYTLEGNKHQHLLCFVCFF